MRRRLIGFNIHAPATESSVISVTNTVFTTVADDGNSYSLDSAVASIRLPDRTTISAGWSISVTCTFSGRYVLVLSGDISLAYFQYDGADCDGVSLDAIGASVVITFDGTYYTAPLSENISAYAV